MSASVQDRPGTDPATFHANIVEVPGQPHNLTVTGKATGDYRVESVSLVRAHHQPNTHTLVLDVTANLGPVENPHPEIERVFDLEYKEDPARHRYTKVEIVNGHQRFDISVTFTL
jgi:hypothetical protein